ncbi:hypothetical protein H8E77_03975 [bacterium]|nr:hypothetical protein [bacterium]
MTENIPKITINFLFRFHWEKAGTLAWKLKNIPLDDDFIRMFVMKFFPLFVQEYPLDKPELLRAWKGYLKEKQEEFQKICHEIETIARPFFAIVEEHQKQMPKAKMFFTKPDIKEEDLSPLDFFEIMEKHWRGWYGENNADILTQVALLDLQSGLMEGNIFLCQNCGELFLRPERGPEPSFCSTRCQNQYYYRKRVRKQQTTASHLSP